MRHHYLPVSALALGLAVASFTAVPAMAQNDQGGGNKSTASTSSGGSAPSGSLEMSHGKWRSSELVGATVYNDEGKSIGTISDLLIGSDGQVSQAILSVGGFLGIGSKLVAEPFSKLKFVPSDNGGTKGAQTADGAAPAGTGAGGGASAGSSGTAPAPAAGTGTDATSTANAPGNSGSTSAKSDYSVTLPGATVDSLKSEPAFNYNEQ